jgi:DNA repair ATPase RecN
MEFLVSLIIWLIEKVSGSVVTSTVKALGERLRRLLDRYLGSQRAANASARADATAMRIAEERLREMTAERDRLLAENELLRIQVRVLTEEILRLNAR